MHANAFPALVLNADFRPLSYFPLSTIPWQDAIKGIYEKTHFVVKEYDAEVRSPSTTIRLPSVLAVMNYVRRPPHVAFTRFNVFLRDHFTCQYCGGPFSPNHLTFDHVVPRARGGQTEWTNVAAACDRCNGIKADRVDMKPIRMPAEPTAKQLLSAKRAYPPHYLHESWLDYLYWDTELQR